MLFPDLALARRLEFHEAWSSSEHVRMQAQLYPETHAVARPLRKLVEGAREVGAGNLEHRGRAVRMGDGVVDVGVALVGQQEGPGGPGAVDEAMQPVPDGIRAADPAETRAMLDACAQNFPAYDPIAS